MDFFLSLTPPEMLSFQTLVISQLAYNLATILVSDKNSGYPRGIIGLLIVGT